MARNKRNQRRERNQRNQRNKGAGKGKGKGAGGGKGKGAGPKTYTGIYEPGEILRGPALRRAVTSSVNSQVNPVLRSLHNQVQNLQKERNYEEERQQQLGNQAAFNTKSYYDSLAQKEAQILKQREGVGTALSGLVSQAGKDTQTAIAGAGAAAQGSIGANSSGQDIGARDRLTQMIAEAGINAGKENQILQGQTATTSNAGSNLLAEMASVAQMRGGEQLKEQQGYVRNAKEKIRNAYASQIGKSRNAQLELLQQKPELFRKVLSELRGTEREQENARAALGIERAGLGVKREANRAKAAESKAGVTYANVSAKNNLELAKIKHEYRMEELEEQGASSAQKQAEKEAWRKEEIKLLEGAGLAGGGKGGGKGKEGWKEYSGAKAYFDSLNIPGKALAKGFKDPKTGVYKSGKAIRTDIYAKLRNNGVSDAYAKKIIRDAIKHWKRATGRSYNTSKGFPVA